MNLREAMRGTSVACTTALAVFLLQCSSGGSGGVGNGADAGACPQAPPAADTACTLPSGTVCGDYASSAGPCAGGSPSFVCQNGKWIQFSTGGPPSGGTAAGCPATVPAEGAPCSQCGGAQLACEYSCATGNGSVSNAQCVGGAWHVTKSAVSCDVDGAAADAASAADANDGGAD